MVDGDARVVDLESHNGISVNGSPISGESRLRPRDNILLANVILIFYPGLRTQTRRSLLELADLTQRATAMIKARRPFILVTLALSLAKQLIDAARERAHQPRMALSPATTEVLLRYRWPGNIRELKNVMEYVAVAGSGLVVEPSMLPARVNPPHEAAGAIDKTLDGALASFRPIDEELRELERSRMVAALAACDGNQTRAAELIDMPRRTFVQKLKQYNLIKKGEETR
jgi:pSer/pThr/pTyr-binding forkhead associated (FHA) protein